MLKVRNYFGTNLNIQNETEGGKRSDSSQSKERSKEFATAAIGNAYALTLPSYVILASGISYVWSPSSNIMKVNKHTRISIGIPLRKYRIKLSVNNLFYL